MADAAPAYPSEVREFCGECEAHVGEEVGMDRWGHAVSRCCRARLVSEMTLEERHCQRVECDSCEGQETLGLGHCLTCPAA